MNELKLVSPLLDGFAAGNAMSCHHGISCYPAMHNDSNDKFIIKTIRIPASQTQLDALLLSGAYSSVQEASAYFHQVTGDTLSQIKLLDTLAQHHAFLAYEGCQVEEEETGYTIYLLSHYRHSLEKYLRRNQMTHLAAVNLGIDLCSALDSAREQGFLYVDLKPSNIYRMGPQEYRIGDIGFVDMASLSFCSLPESCISPYSPPEMTDAFSCIGTTADTYALGLVLYMIYNGGELPFQGQRPEDLELEAPAFADFEMGQIILKACALDPSQRWESPKQMGQALIDYMQRNEVNDISIQLPPVQQPSEPAEPVQEDGQTPEPQEPEDPQPPQESANEPAGDRPDNAQWMEHIDALLSEDSDSGEEGEQLSIATILADAPQEETPDDATVTDEVSEILNKADELIAHEAPAPAVAPDPIDVPVPPPIPAEEPQDAPRSEPANEEEPVEEPEPAAEHVEPPEEKKTRKTHKGIWIAIVLVLFLTACAFAVNFYYNELYLQEVYAFSAQGTQNYVDVFVQTNADQSLLSVVCTDTYGTKYVSNLSDGHARFENLSPNSHYTISLEISGFHKLTGPTECTYTSPSETTVVSFTCVAGAEDGSALLNFTVTGAESTQWKILCQAQGEEDRIIPCNGHMATVSGLTVDKEYTFSLVSEEGIYLQGQTQLVYTAQKIAYAQDITMESYSQGTLVLSWTSTEGTNPESWSIHCYHENGGEIDLEVKECSATIEGLDPKYAYTIEITAQGMTQNSRTYLSANPIVIDSFTEDTSDPGQLSITWQYQGQAPEGGWLVLYSINDSTTQEVVRTDTNTAVISPVVPGAVYHFSVQSAQGTKVFGDTWETDLPDPVSFADCGTTASSIDVSMCETPEVLTWTADDVKNYTTSFTVGQKASLVLRCYSYNPVSTRIVTTMVFRDTDGNCLYALAQESTWINMWYRGWCYFDIERLPQQAGSYQMELYFNGALVDTIAFTVT